MVISNDEFIARTSNEFPDWSGKGDKNFFIKTTKRTKAVIMGNSSFKPIGKGLPGRDIFVMTRSPKDSAIEGVTYTDKHPVELLSMLIDMGYNEVTLGGGSQINTLFAQAELIHEVILVKCENVTLGAGIPLFADMPTYLKDNFQLDKTETLQDQFSKTKVDPKENHPVLFYTRK